MPRPKVTLEEAFARAVARFPQLGPDECWPWPGPYNKQTGMPIVSIDRPGGANCTHFSPVRLQYDMRIGPMHPTRRVYHRCGNKACGNPAHLYQGRAAENHWRLHRLPPDHVQAIKEDPRPDHVVAGDHGVSPSHVAKLRRIKQVYKPRR